MTRLRSLVLTSAFAVLTTASFANAQSAPGSATAPGKSGAAVSASTAAATGGVPMLTAHHFALSVPSIEETSRWYQTHLGFKIKQPETDAPEVGSKVALLEQNGFILELYEKDGSTKPEKPMPKDIPTDLSVQGPKHIAFMTTDVDALAAKLKGDGVKFLAEPTDLKATNLHVINIFDNNGNVIEIAEPLAMVEPAAGATTPRGTEPKAAPAVTTTGASDTTGAGANNR